MATRSAGLKNTSSTASTGAKSITKVSTPSLHLELPRGVSNVALQDLPTSEDEDERQGQLPTNDARSLVAFSIGREQTRLTLPTTPSVEKAAALQASHDTSIFFGDQVGVRPTEVNIVGTSSPNREPRPQRDAQQYSEYGSKSTTPDLPSPWRSSPRVFEVVGEDRPTFLQNLRSGRLRASSGSITENIGSVLRKHMSFSIPSLPSMPKGMSMVNAGLSKVSAQLPFAPNPKREHNLQDLGNLGRPRSKTETRLSPKPQIAYDPQVAGEGSTGTPLQIEHRPTHRRSQSDDVALSPSATRTQVAAQDGQSDPPSRGKGADPRPDETRPSPIYSRPLRRTNSDISLVLRRSMSTASSLGDDTRFEDVREAVNSRFKALRDSMVDSRIRLPNMASIHDVSLPSFRLPELNVLRGATSSNGQSKATVPQDRPGLSTNASDGSKHSSTTILSLTDREGRTRPTPLSRGDDASYLTNALRNLTGDVVIMGGYRGSILRSAKPPHRQLWIPVKVGLNLRRADLEVGLAPEDEENMESRIIASGMLTHVGPVDIARRLIKRLKTCENAKSGILRVWDYGYDWRLSPHLLSRRFMAFMQSLPSNKDKVRPQGATVIAHSLGGLITRHAVNQRPELFAGVVYAGVPQACVNILGPLRNGDEVLLSSRVLTAQVNFTIRTSYALLPEDGRCFIDKRTKETYPVDFFDVNTWVEHCLSPCVAPPLPALIRQREGLGKRGSSSALIKLPLPGKKVLAAVGQKMTESGSDSEGEKDRTIAPQMGGESNPGATGHSTNSAVATAVSIPRPQALAYLARTLAEIREFKSELHFRPERASANAYPPAAVLYGKSVPTVYGARVDGIDGIKRADAYEHLAFASGDGVCLARAAMLPEGYELVPGGRVSSDRGHVTLLGDLEGVGRCLLAVMAGRRRGIGLGLEDKNDAS